MNEIDEATESSECRYITEVKELVKGLVVIIDDAFSRVQPKPEDDDSIAGDSDKVWQIRDYLVQEGYPVVAYSEVPDKTDFSLTGASFFIIDWNMMETNIDGVPLGPSLLKSQQQDVLSFVFELIRQYPVPVFIFTNESPKLVKEEVHDFFGLNNMEERATELIFVESKSNVGCSAEELFKAIAGWLQENPAAYAMETWRKTVIDGANDLFNRLYNASSSWPSLIWETLSNDFISEEMDSAEMEALVSNEFGSFLTHALDNTLIDYPFSSRHIQGSCSGEAAPDVIRRVVEQGRYIKFSVAAKEPCRCGDLFHLPKTCELIGEIAERYGVDRSHIHHYVLVVSADCDLVRRQDPMAAVVFGSDVSIKNGEGIVLEASADGSYSISINGKSEIISEDSLDSINKNIRKVCNSSQARLHRGGTLLRRQTETIIPCIAGRKAIAFSHELFMLRYSEIKKYRIGRVLPPYITKVQQGASAHLVRAALEPVPLRAFD